MEPNNQPVEQPSQINNVSPTTQVVTPLPTSGTSHMMAGLLVFVVLVLGGGGVYYYLNRSDVGHESAEKVDISSEADTSTLETHNNAAGTLVSYTSPVFGVKFEFPETIKSVKTNIVGNYYGPEVEVTESEARELLKKPGTGAGWNAQLLNNCKDSSTPYCFGVEIGIWPVIANAKYSNEIPFLGDANHRVYLSRDEHEARNDTLQGSGSPTHYATYSIVNNSRNLVVNVSFLTAKSQMNPLSDTDIQGQEELFNYIKDNIVPSIIKSVEDTDTRKFEMRTPYSMP